MAGIQDVDIGSFDPDYLALCVRFAQTHGVTPSVSHSDTNIECDNPRALHTSRYQRTGHAVDHQGLEPGPSNGRYLNSNTGSTLADTSYPRHNNGHYPNTCNQATTIDSAYINHTGSIPSSNDSIIINQGSSLSASNTPVPAQIPKRRSRNAKTKFPQKTPLSRPHSRAVNKIGGNKDLAIRNNYDPLWVQKTGVDPSSVFEFASKMKFEVLFTAGVIREGDELVIGYTSAFSTEVDQGVATLTYIGFSPATRRTYPNLVLTLSSHPGRRTINDCSGPSAIMTEFAKCGIRGPDIVPALATNLRVWHGDQDLGPFIFVRQAYHTWMNKMDAEAQRAGTKWRNRSGDLRKVVAVQERKQKLTMRVEEE